MSEDRITELEIKVAYQEDVVQSLNNIVADQQRQISQLETVCQLLNDRLKSLSESASAVESDSGYEVPPHY